MPLPESPPVAPEPPKEPGTSAAFWAALAVALGAVLLVGAAGGVFWMARSRGPSAAASATPSVPGVAASTTTPTAPPQPEPSPARALPVPEELPGMVGGLRIAPGEESAALPISADRPGFGTELALVTIAAFGDLECPHTREALGAVLRVAAGARDKLRFAFFHAPLANRPTARQLARALTRATLEHGSDAGFRLLHRAAQTSEVVREAAVAQWLAEAVGSAAADKQSIGENSAADAVARDERLGTLLAVRGTPTLFVNGARIEGVPSDGELEQLIADEARAVRWLRGQGVAPAETYARRVRRNLINLEAEAPDRECVSSEGAPVQGSPDALLTIVEFSDFDCSHCRALSEAMQPVVTRHRSNIRRLWRTFSTTQQPRANRSALVALAARAVGGDTAFWAAHDALLRSPHGLTDAGLLALAQGLGLEERSLLAAIHDPRRFSELERDERLVKTLGLLGAPTLFLNGRRVTGAVPTAVFARLVDEELAAAKRLVRQGTQPADFQSLLCEGLE